MTEHRLTTPIDDETVSRLKVGDIIYLSGTVFTARDEAHMELLKDGAPRASTCGGWRCTTPGRS